MIVAPAGPEHVDVVAALESELFGVDAWSPAMVREEFVGEDRRALVALDGPTVVGYAVMLRAGEVVDLQRIGVRLDRRRGGTARLLLDALVALAVADGAERMLLEVAAGNDGARAFYEATGFTEVARRRRYYRDGDDALVLARPLQSPVPTIPENEPHER